MQAVTRRSFLRTVGTSAAAGAGLILISPMRSRALGATAPPTYTWAKVIDGGGFCNVIAADPSTPGAAAAGGDVWGEHTTSTYGNLWTPTMIGAGGIGDIYARAVTYSAKTPGVPYFGIGTLKGGGGAFCAVEGLDLQVRSKSIGFSSQLAAGAAGAVPRPAGNLIQIDFDPTTGTEYIYALTNQGLVRSVNGGQSWTVLGLTSVPSMAWSALCLAPDGSLYAASFRTSATGGSKVWRITTPRAGATISQLRSTPAVVEDIRTIGSTVYAACGTSGLYTVTPSTWSAVASSTFAGCHLSSVAGLGSTIYVGSGSFPKGSMKCIAVSTDGGQTFHWTTSAGNVIDTVAGTNRSWWLAAGPSMPGDHYTVSQLTVDAFNPAICYSAGRGGVWVTRNSGGIWQPAMQGLGGDEVNAIRVGSAGQAWAADTDWNGITTSSSWQSYARTMSPGSFGSPNLSRSAGGNSYQVKSSSVPRDILVNGQSVANDYFRAACISPTDLQISSAGDIYVGLYGGGVLLGTPE